jgi:hypothetical protein
MVITKLSEKEGLGGDDEKKVSSKGTLWCFLGIMVAAD